VRTKQFDPSAAIEKALRIFWKNGYERTSVNDLVEGMGINRGSLYDTFGDKYTLYLKCLNRYSEMYTLQVVDVLSRKLPVRETLEHIFSSLIDLLHEDGCNWGCFMTNTANELSLHDNRVAHLVSDNFERLEQAFTGFIKHGVDSGQLSPGLDPQKIGRYLTSSFAGIATLAKTQLPASFMKDAIQTALSVLR